MESGRLYQPVQKTSEVITKFVNKKCPKGKLPREFKDVSDEEFEKVQLSEKVGKFSFDFEIEEPKEREIDVENEKSEEGLSATATGESASEKSKRIAEEIEKFNNGLTQRTREFIILCAFKQVIQNIIKEYAEVKSAVVEGSVDSSDEVVVHKLSVLFDFQIFIVKHSPSTKVIFYQTLALATDSLFLISTDIIEKFWFYLENRRSTIKQHVFDSNATSDRVAILEICNALTDKFNTRSLHLQNKTDTYKKDSFNDEFQSRVRVFLASILTLEDNTGLNKYFSTADIVSQDIITSIGTKNKDDTLLRDIIQLNKLFRDPYYYIKRENYSLLIGMSKIMLKVFNYLIDEEAKYFSAHPLRDHFSVGSESTQVTGEEKKNIGGEIVEENDENNDSKIFFSEIYSLAAFDDIKKGEKYDELKKKDTDFFARQFDENDKYRQTTLLQIYIFSSLYYELAQSNKKIFLQNIGGPLGLKHFTDNSTPESLVPIFYKIKKELTKRYRNFDNAFGHLLHNLYLTEVFWWSWLLYGKDKQLGKPLFADKVLTMVELLAVEEKSKTILPLKEKDILTPTLPHS